MRPFLSCKSRGLNRCWRCLFWKPWNLKMPSGVDHACGSRWWRYRREWTGFSFQKIAESCWVLSLKEKHSIPVGKVMKFISQSLETEVAADCGERKTHVFSVEVHQLQRQRATSSTTTLWKGSSVDSFAALINLLHRQIFVNLLVISHTSSFVLKGRSAAERVISPRLRTNRLCQKVHVIL